MAVPRREWMLPSHAQSKTFCGDEDRTRFRLKAKTHDGKVVWVGWFDDRDDADAFLFALFSGSLRYERELWRLPTPQWHPGISTDLVYDFVTQTILTTTQTLLTYTSPSDWDNSSNQIECLGGGAGGAKSVVTTNHATGGGGGAYSAITNFSFATPGVTQASYQVAGGRSSKGGPGTEAGSAGRSTWWNDTVYPGGGTTNAKCAAEGGFGGAAGSGSQSGGAGGTTANSWGQTKYAGGRGGNLTGASGQGASGGGGAAGPSGAGGNGGDSASTSLVTTAGGSANNGTTAGGTNAGGDGNAGTEFSASYGCGSGGGGAALTSGVATSGLGGNYGGASGGACGNGTGNAVADASAQGLIIVEYTPTVSPFVSTNLPMMGM